MKVLVCDDNKSFAGVVSNFLASQNDVEKVDIAFNGKEAVEKIIQDKPDVVLLDLLMPELDGLGVMEKLATINLDKMPKVVLESGISQENVIKEALELGAYSFIMKPFELPVLADRMRTAYEDDMPASTCFITEPYDNKYVNIKEVKEVSKEINVEVEVTNLMHRLGIPANIKGYQYLREALMRVIEDRGLVTGITKELYPDVANKFNTTSAKVERAIRHAIEISWIRGRMDILEETFGYTISPERGKPTNSEFIAMVADKIRMDLRVAAKI